jgi:antibiotic biosynthesis monooxygenase (ABM) superfamily enzyme
MKNIRVIITKIPVYKDFTYTKAYPYINNFINFQNRLSKQAAKFPGFITSESYWKINGLSNTQSTPPIINISNWDNETSWNNWIESNDRKLVLKEHNDIEYHENIDICKGRRSYIDTPLL